MHAEFKALLTAKRAPLRRTPAPLGPAIDKVLKAAKRAFRRSEAARRAWRQIAPQSLVERCDVWTQGDWIMVECSGGVAFEQALRIRQTFWREALKHFAGLDSPTGVRVVRAEVQR